MNRELRYRLSSSITRTLALAAMLVLIWCASVVPVQATTCYNAINMIYEYFSTPAHTTLVGTCSVGPCPFAGCSGQKTAYFTIHNSILCEVCP